MDYATLSNKILRTDSVSGEDIKDMLTLTFVIPEEYQYKIFQVPTMYIARPDLISLDQYGTSDYADVICKLNAVSNPYEINEGMLLILPLNSQIKFFYFDNDTIETQDSGADDEAPKAKSKVEKRKANEAVVGDTRFKVDTERRIVIY